MTAEVAGQYESATVWTTASGIPERMVWQGRRFIVTDRPIPWIDRVQWWMSSDRVPASRASQSLEQQMWQVQVAAEDNGQILIVDLAVSPGNVWPVTGIYD